MFAQASTAWMAVIVWKTEEAPRYLKGYSFTAACAFCLAIWTFVVLYFYKRQEKGFARQNGIVLYNSKTDPDSVPESESEASVTKVREPTSPKGKADEALNS
ncbi:uncharacterized protein CXQ87_003164 [Candidozyma duobushaemuli]|uniref:Uncharacterized protein n=1 Tax=Candidozyma duobushaemuli TaxID=1231522 RepID=A0A2V1ACP2_9ASCO|nr:uncharacterized protein CXQ87_003164 [[Candida] duobushaemulonis]PVH15326.1 hypothetical protein CXQ87_003164 [[Candida] duobushaemulonis]